MSTTTANKKTATQAAAHAEQGTGQNALIFGANGISGIAAITKLLEKPESEWAKVIAVSRRPPQLDFKDPRLIFVSIDLLSTPIPEIAKRLLDNGASEVHHAFFYAYIAKATDEETTEINTDLLKRSLQAVENACPDLKSFTLQTGMKHYGCHIGPEQMAPMPFEEDGPRPVKNSMFYYPQEDLLKETCEKNSWRWIVTRPNIIIGVSKGNFMNFAVTAGLYAALQKQLGRQLDYPGNDKSYYGVCDFSTATNNAAFQIWAATHPNAGNNAYNITDNTKMTMRDLWTGIAKYFSLSVPEDKIAKAEEGEKPKLSFSLEEYMKANSDQWHQIASKQGLDDKAFEFATFGFLDGVAGATWPTEGSMQKAESKGWAVKTDTIQSVWETFDKMKLLHIIPS